MYEPHVQLVLDQENTIPQQLRTALNRLQARVSLRSMDKAYACGVSPSADACVILPGADEPPDILERILEGASNQACAAMVIPAEQAADQETDASLPRQRPKKTRTSEINADELTGRIKALCEIRSPLKKMHEELTNLRRRDAELTSDARQINEQLVLAGQIQNDLLSEPVLDADPLSIKTLFLPADLVSGDVYDISRLDEHQFGLSIADATGHGLPAALLTIFIKNLLCGKEIYNGSYRIIEPDELLSKLNHNLLDNNLTQCQFITAVNAILDRRTKQVRWARGGIPYPILIRPGHEPRQIRSGGGLIGAFEKQSYEIAKHDFEPGDVLLFFSDGLEALLLGKKANLGDESILKSPWIEQLNIDGPNKSFKRIRRLAADMPATDWHRDDITAIAVTMN